jgi:hypothetical protein
MWRHLHDVGGRTPAMPGVIDEITVVSWRLLSAH